jgi:AbiV family abortive infection protein
MHKTIRKYEGKLSPSQVAEGMNCAYRNAKRLAMDANLLLKAGSYPTATSIAILSIEESGKVVILRKLLIANSEEEVGKCWKEFRTHTKKNLNWILPDLFDKGARKIEDFYLMVDKNSEHPFYLNGVKQLGFYTDCVDNADWSNPEQNVDEEQAKRLVRVAHTLLQDKEVSSKELELHVKHMKFVPKDNDELVKQANINWYKDMQDHGLMPPGENKMAVLFRNGLSKDVKLP